MHIDLTFFEIDEILTSLHMAAHEANKSANMAISEGYPPSVKAELSSKASNLYLLAEKIEDQRRRCGVKEAGSSGSVDPYDTPLEAGKTQSPGGSSKYDSPRSPNDPIEW